ncbi:tetratricopeptide repeat protein [Sulfurimonas sp. CS5]|uniref:tetratricopeptide repeat protein n=1 Tax=Sulfurimonas sp. CS5 TaxID=3391145 RepID=UPI0039E9FBA8
MIKIFLSLFLILLFSGCVSKTESLKPNEKAFAQEDTYILFALRAQELKDYDSASSIFNTLYEKSAKNEYLYKSLQNDLAANKNADVVSKVNRETDGKIEDFKLIRLKIVALIGDQKYEEARVLSIKLVEKSKDVNDYVLVSEIYVKQKKYDTALKYLESAYTKDYNEKILDRMSIILYVNLQRNKEAIAQLETHARMHGCSQIICTRLIGFYSNENNIDGLLSVYLRMYELEKSDDISKKIVQIYAYKKEYIKLMSFLQKSGSDDELLFQVYINAKKYKQASKLAKELYHETGDINYLGQSAIFEYESHKNKADKKMQDSVIKNLKKVVNIEKKPLYLNYLGYLLIDHSIDIKGGMGYIREALIIEPNSAFYLDSLAWGYYKLGKCEKAYKIISKAKKLEGGDDPEVLKHLKTIKKCKNKKVKDKKKK